GVHAFDATVTVANATLEKNGDGVIAEGGSQVQVVDSIVSNSVQVGVLALPTMKSPTIAVNSTDVWNSGVADYSGLGSGPGSACLTLDPKYTNPAADDYHLQSGSPCIDTAFIADGITVDLDGVMRPLDGDGAWTADPDMGCYEAPAAPPNPNPCNAGGT